MIPWGGGDESLFAIAVLSSNNRCLLQNVIDGFSLINIR